MAIYHLEGQTIGRSSGGCATRAAAYRSAARILDERTGEVHDFRRKKGVYKTLILAPEGVPQSYLDRNTLWNTIEKIEKRCDAQLCREFNIALPKELSHAQKIELARDYVQRTFVDKGMIADVCFHDFETGNPHFHMMLTMRHVTAEGFGNKNRDWNDKALFKQWRIDWAAYANEHLDKAKRKERIDHRILFEQGQNRLADVHYRFKEDSNRPLSLRSAYQIQEQARRDGVNRTMKVMETQVRVLEAKLKHQDALERRNKNRLVGIRIESHRRRDNRLGYYRSILYQEQSVNSLIVGNWERRLAKRPEHQVEDERKRIEMFKRKLAAKVARERGFPSRAIDEFPLPAPVGWNDAEAIYHQIHETVQYADLYLEQQWRVEEIWSVYAKHKKQQWRIDEIQILYRTHVEPQRGQRLGISVDDLERRANRDLSSAKQYRLLMGFLEEQGKFSHDKVAPLMRALGYTELEVWQGRRHADPFLINQHPVSVQYQHSRLYQAFNGHIKSYGQSPKLEAEDYGSLPTSIVWSDLETYQQALAKQVLETYDREEAFQSYKGEEYEHRKLGEVLQEQRFHQIWAAWSRSGEQLQDKNLCPVERYRVEMARQWFDERDNPEREFQSKMSHDTVVERMIAMEYEVQEIWQGRRFADPWIVQFGSARRLVDIHHGIVKRYEAHRDRGGQAPPEPVSPTGPTPIPSAPQSGTVPQGGVMVTSTVSESPLKIKIGSTFFSPDEIMPKTFVPEELTEADLKQLYETAYTLNGMLADETQLMDEEERRVAQQAYERVKKALWQGAGVSGKWVDTLRETPRQYLRRQVNDTDFNWQGLLAKYHEHQERLQKDRDKEKEKQKAKAAADSRRSIKRRDAANRADDAKKKKAIQQKADKDQTVKSKRQQKKRNRTKTVERQKAQQSVAQKKQTLETGSQSQRKHEDMRHRLRRIQDKSVQDLARLEKRYQRSTSTMIMHDAKIRAHARRQNLYGSGGEMVTNGFARSKYTLTVKNRPLSKGMFVGLAKSGASIGKLTGMMKSQGGRAEFLGVLRAIANRQRLRLQQSAQAISPVKAWKELKKGYGEAQKQQQLNKQLETRREEQKRRYYLEVLKAEQKTQKLKTQQERDVQRRPELDNERVRQGGKTQDKEQTLRTQEQEREQSRQEREAQRAAENAELEKCQHDLEQQKQTSQERSQSLQKEISQEVSQEQTNKDREVEQQAEIEKAQQEIREELEREHQRQIALAIERNKGRDY